MRRLRSGREGGDLWKGLAAGLIGGFVGSWSMNQLQSLWDKLSEVGEQPQQKGSSTSGLNQHNRQQDQEANGEKMDDTTVKAASAISECVFGHRLTKSEKEYGGAVVHYAVGAATGGLYGAFAEVAPSVSAVAGLPFGAAFWLVVDEMATPALGLSKAATKYPLSIHLYALASHLVFGVTTEGVRRVVRGVL